MPKIISDYERAQTKKAIINHATQLVYIKKGIKNITVDDIIHSVGLGKGTFYSYFLSKEECFYEVIENAYAELLGQFNMIMQENVSLKVKISKFLREVYLAENSINHYIAPNDFETLLRKLPPEYSERELGASDNVITSAMQVLNLGRIQMESLTMLLDCIDYVATYPATPKLVKDATLDILILSIAEYVEKNTNIEE